MDTTIVHAPRGQRTAVLIVGMVLLAVIVIGALFRDRFIYANQYQVSVVGEGRVEFVADTALVTLGVQVDKAPTATMALDRLNSAMNAVVPALVALGIPAENIETHNYYLSPHYDVSDFGTNPAGYNANQQLVVTVESVENLNEFVSKVIAEANKSGVNQVLDVTFTPSNLEDLKQQARILALQDAQKKAEETAEATGVELKKLIGWWENMISYPGQNKAFNFGYGYGGGGEGGGGFGGPVFPTSEQEIVVQMSANYVIK